MIYPDYFRKRPIFFALSHKNCNFGTDFNCDRKVLIGIIANYLTEHRRLVVPQLGTFIVKVPEGDVVFSELLKRDDGVLRGLLVRGGANELEAAGIIDRFVFEVRHALDKEGEYRIENFGRMVLSPAGAIVFYRDVPASGCVDPVAVPGAKPTVPAADAGVPERSAAPAKPSVKESAAREEAAARSQQAYVKGLQYGRPLKTTRGYAYVGERPRRRVDKFVVLAVLVAVLAVGVIAYGYWREVQNERLEREYMEQLLSPVITGPTADPTE